MLSDGSQDPHTIRVWDVCVCVCETRYNIRIFYNFVQRSKEDNMWRQ